MGKQNAAIKIVCENRKARHDFFIHETFETGLELKGTEILKNEGYDLSYIHYTGVADWYARLGYQSILQWTSQGILTH